MFLLTRVNIGVRCLLAILEAHAFLSPLSVRKGPEYEVKHTAAI